MTSVRLSFGSRAGGSVSRKGDHSIGFSSRGPFDSLEALADALKTEIEDAAQSIIPDCTTTELSLTFKAVLPLRRPIIGPYADGGQHDLPSEFRPTSTNDNRTVVSDPSPKATAGHILNIADAKERQIVQRAASRGIVRTIEMADGYRYSFNNAWSAKDEDGSRFSYICQDSVQNKDRHANGFTRTQKHLKGEGEKGARKPTYDCKGSVSVKFSSGRQSVDVYYRHFAIHATVAGRKAQQKSLESPRMERPKETGGLVATLQAENYASSALQMVQKNVSLLSGRSQSSNIGQSLKRKREEFLVPRPLPPTRNSVSNKPLSLAELLQQSEGANASPKQSKTPNGTSLKRPIPVTYGPPPGRSPPLNNTALRQTDLPPNQPPSGSFTFSQPQTSAGLFYDPVSRPTASQSAPHGLFTTMKPMAEDAPARSRAPKTRRARPKEP